MTHIIRLILIFGFITNLAATPQIRLEQLSLDQGLSQGEVNTLMQDSDGFLWLGTQQGLNVFDGHRIRVISGPDNLLEIQQINSIYEDSRKNIWVGSVPNRNFRIEKNTNKIIEVTPPFPANRDVTDSAFMEVLDDQQGTIWLATFRALFRYDQSSGEIKFFIDFEPTLDKQNLIRELFVFEDHLLVATSNGLYAVNRENPALIEIPYSQSLKSDDRAENTSLRDDRLNAKGIIMNSQGNIMLATVEGLYELSSQSLHNFLTENNSTLDIKVLEPELNIWKIIEEPEFYWLATNEGLFQLFKNGQKQKVLNYSDSVYQSVDNNILAMIKDNEGNLWLGSRNDGTFKWTPNSGRFTFYQQSNEAKNSLSNGQVWSIKEANDGSIWIGTNNGLNHLDPGTGQINQYLVNPDKKATTSESTVYDIELQGDQLWLATVGSIQRFDTTTGQKNPPLLSPEASKIFTEPTSDIFPIDDKNIGIIQEKGIYTYNTQSGQISFNENTANDGKVQHQLQVVSATDPNDKDKRLITMADQVVSYSISSGTYKVVHALPPSDTPRTYAQDIYVGEKYTWIAYPGFGIYIIDNQTGQEIKHFSSLDGLPDNSPLQFIDDKLGNIWVTSNSGLIRFDQETFHFRVFDVNDGLATNEFNGGTAILAKSGEIYFGTIKGVVKVDPKQMLGTGTKRILHNHITNISLMSRKIPETFSPIVNHALNILHTDYGLKIQYSALSLTSPKKLRYKYWLEGSSKTSPHITKESELFLPKLEPGDSVFKVSVIDFETGAESPPESVFLNIQPHPAFTWWAYTFYIGFLFSISFTIYWQRRKRNIALLEAHQTLKTNEERLHLALTGSDSGLWDWQAKDDQVFTSIQKGEDLHQGNYYSFKEHLEKMHESDRERYRKTWQEFLQGKMDVFDFVYRWRTNEGNYFWYRDLARVTEVGDDNRPSRVTGTYMDVTQAKTDRDKIILFSEAFQNTRDVVLISDENFVVKAANSALYRATGFEDENILNQHLNFLMCTDNQIQLVEKMSKILEHTGHWDGEGILRRLYQQPLPVLVTANTFLNESEEKRYVFAITDISQQKHAEDELRKLANYDRLTGLPNRALLMDRISHALENAKRNQKQIALFFVDLDRFKQVNDSLGHDVGDLLLTGVARVLKQCTRQSDTVARLGGDEFVIMLEDIANVEAVSRIAQSILDRMSTPFQLGKNEVSASPSIGIALFPGDGKNSEELFKHADIAMYHAKNSGRNNFKYFTNEMNENAQSRLRLENDIRAAIKNNEFIYHYQPKISLVDRKIVGFECLARWKKADGTIIAPFDFIPMAEELGLIIDITEQLIEQALINMQKWHELGVHTQFAFNLSARHLHHYDLTQFVSDKLKAYEIPASAIEFELTESAIMEDMTNAIELLNNLSQQGIAISLDDFGTGYTSFQYLKDFPITALKIDRSFVKDIGCEPKDEAIIDSIITLANKLGIQTIAEGIETIEQAEYLQAKGCPIGQGYFYSKPVPVEQAFKLISNNPFMLDK